MSRQQIHRADWLADLLGLLDRPVDMLIHPLQHGAGQPRFEFGSDLPAPRPVALPAGEEEEPTWPRELTSAITEPGWRVGLIYPLAFPSRPGSLKWTADDRRFSDEAAFLAAALDAAGPARTLVVLVSMNLLTGAAHASFRGWLSQHHRPTWLVYLGSGAARSMGVHASFRMGLLVVDTGPDDGGVHLLRLADVRDLEPPEWPRILRSVARRGGGEVGSTVVLRDPRLDSAAWTYERFSRQFQAVRDDAGQLGSFATLEELTDVLGVGLSLKPLSHRLEDLEETGDLPSGTVACYGAPSIQRDGRLSAPRWAVRREGLESEQLLAPGDLVIRAIAQPEERLVVAEATPEHLPAVTDHTLIRLRFKPEVSPQSAELIRGYLSSNLARDWLIASGLSGARLQIDVLRGLEVPIPRDEILEALSSLSRIERHYRDWAEEIERARAEIFAARSYAEAVPILLDRQRQETERFRAAADAGSLDYQVRNYYPHPISLRREQLMQHEHGKERLEAVLECAEHLLTLLALAGMIQLARDRDSGSPAPEAGLLSFVKNGSLLMDWGKWLSVFESAVAFTGKHENPLALPFPELLPLTQARGGDASPWRLAESRLRQERNRLAHLQRLPEAERRTLSRALSEDLDRLLECVSFLATSPLVHVSDYVLSPRTAERTATFRLLQGASPVFRREMRSVSAECPRDVVGFLDHRGEFHTLFPWLVLDACPVCKQSELFVFNRWVKESVTYVAMESGHAMEREEPVGRWQQLLQSDL